MPHINQQTLPPLESTQQDIAEAMGRSLAYLEFTVDGIILNANENYLALSGYALQELVGKNFKCLWTGEELISPNHSNFWDKLRAGKPVVGVFKRQRKDGGIFWVEAAYYPLSGQSGTPEKIMAFGIDVTEAIMCSKENKRRLEAVERSFIVAFYSADGVFLEGNENFISTLGYSEQELLNKRLKDMLLLNTEEQDDFEEFLSFIRAGNSESRRLLWLAQNPYPVCLYSIFTPMFNGNGSVDKIMHVAWDITSSANQENEKYNHLSLFYNIIDSADSAVAITDTGHKTVYINEAYTNMFGYTQSEMLEKFPTTIFGPEEKNFLCNARKHLNTFSHYRSEEIAYCKNGKRLWVSMHVFPILDQDGKREHMVNIITDITELKLNEILQGKTLEGLARDMPTSQLLNLLSTEIERIMPGLRIGVIGINSNNTLIPLAGPSLSLTQLGESSLGCPSEENACFDSVLKEIENDSPQIPTEVKQTFGAYVNDNLCLAAAIRNTSGKTLGAVVFYQDAGVCRHVLSGLVDSLANLCAVIMERDENNLKMRELTFYDPLTGLPNRNLLASGAKHLFEGVHASEAFAVIYIDIDRFSRINHSYSYGHGNDLLHAVAARLTLLKGENDLVGRMFADEFVVISPGCDAGQALDKAKRIQTELAKPFDINDTELNLTVSIGISLCPNNGSCMDSLLNDANNSLRLNRGKGPGKISFFSTEFNALAKTRLSMEAQLRKAIENERLSLCYQPQVYLCNGKMHGVEALCRWNDKKWGSVPPDQFIPLAEETGLIDKLSDWVLRESCRQLADWRQKGLIVPSMSVNLSAPNFHDTKLPDKIITYLHAFGLNASDIILELTESVLLDKNPAVLSTIQRAHELGLALSLDDFGTGYSSLSYLRSLPFSEIKLDQSFVRDLHTAEVSRRLSEAVMGLGRSLKLTVLAEGVENMAQLRLLKQQNCHAAQGYFLSKPLPPKELEEWIREWRPIDMTDQHHLL